MSKHRVSVLRSPTPLREAQEEAAFSRRHAHSSLEPTVLLQQLSPRQASELVIYPGSQKSFSVPEFIIASRLHLSWKSDSLKRVELI